MALPMCDQIQVRPALPVCDQTPVRPALALVHSGSSLPYHALAVRQLPAKVYWFRRALVAAAILLLAWVSSLLAAELHWSLAPEGPVGLSQPAPAYVIMGDTALPVSPDGR